jgi:iron complex outermembrane receptor protein
VGSELLLRWTTGPLSFTLGHVYVNSTEFPPNSAERATVPLNPRHSGTFLVSWEREAIGRIGFETFYTGRQELIGVDGENPYLTSSPSFVIFGLLLQRQFGPVRVSLNGENLTDRRMTRVQPLILPTRAPDGRWTADAWGPLEGRVINLSVRWRIVTVRSRPS